MNDNNSELPKASTLVHQSGETTPQVDGEKENDSRLTGDAVMSPQLTDASTPIEFPIPYDYDDPVRISIRKQAMRERYNLKACKPGPLSADAIDDLGTEFELRATTDDKVCISQMISLDAIRVWRTRYWVFCQGRDLGSGFKIDSTCLVSPKGMEELLGDMEEHLERLEKIRKKTMVPQMLTTDFCLGLCVFWEDIQINAFASGEKQSEPL